MRVRHGGRIPAEGVHRVCGVIPALQVVLHGLHHLPFDVVIMSDINLGSAAKNRNRAARKESFPVRVPCRIGGGGETRCAQEGIVVIVVLHQHRRAGGDVLARAFPLLRRPPQVVVPVVRPSVAACPPVAVLREDQAVGVVVDVFRRGGSRKLLPHAAVPAVIPVLEGILTQIGCLLVHGLEHEAEVAEVVVHVVGVVRLAALHLPDKHGAPLFVGEGVAGVLFLVHGLQHGEFVGGIAASVGQRSRSAYAVVPAVQRRGFIGRMAVGCVSLYASFPDAATLRADGHHKIPCLHHIGL